MTSGKRSFQDEFFERHDAYLRGRAAVYAHLWSRSSEDVLHDAYVKILNNHWARLEHQLRTKESNELQVREYIDRTMASTTKNAWEAERRLTQREVPMLVDMDSARPEPGVEDTVIFKDQVKLYDECIEELPRQQKAVMRESLSGHSGEDAAKALGIKPGAYRSVLHKGRSQAKRLLEKKTGGELAS